MRTEEEGEEIGGGMMRMRTGEEIGVGKMRTDEKGEVIGVVMLRRMVGVGMMTMSGLLEKEWT